MIVDRWVCQGISHSERGITIQALPHHLLKCSYLHVMSFRCGESRPCRIWQMCRRGMWKVNEKTHGSSLLRERLVSREVIREEVPVKLVD